MKRPPPRAPAPCPSPALRHFQLGRNRNTAGEITRGIEDHRVPFQIQDHVGGDDAALIGLRGREILEIRRHLMRATGHIDMEGVDIHRIARPGERRAAGMEREARHLTSGPLGDDCREASADKARSAARALRPDHFMHAHDGLRGMAPSTDNWSVPPGKPCLAARESRAAWAPASGPANWFSAFWAAPPPPSRKAKVPERAAASSSPPLLAAED